MICSAKKLLILPRGRSVESSVGEMAGVAKICFAERLLNLILGKMSENLCEFLDYLRKFCVGDLFESPLLEKRSSAQLQTVPPYAHGNTEKLVPQ